MALPAAGAIFSALSSAKGAIGGLAGASSFAGATQSLGQLGKAAGAVGSAGLKAATSVTGLASSITGGLLGPLAKVQEVVGTIGQLVQLANPAVMAHFTRAMNDAMAVLGHALTPVMESLTGFTRQWGDALAKLMPVIQPLFDAIAARITAMASTLVPLIEAAAPFIQLFTDALTKLLLETGKVVAFLQGMLIELLRTLATAFGITSRFDPSKSSQGAARRQADVAGVEATAAAIFRAAAQNTVFRKDGQKPKDQLAYMEEIAQALADGRQRMEQVVEFVRSAAAGIQSIWDWIRNRFKEANEAGGKFGRGAGEAVGGKTGGRVGEGIADGLLGGLRRSFLK